jgi:hypothetical protein
MVHAIKVPTCFVVCKDDKLAHPIRVKELFELCGSEDKTFFLIEGDHNGERDSLSIRKCVSFLFKKLSMDQYRAEIAKQINFETANDVESSHGLIRHQVDAI